MSAPASVSSAGRRAVPGQAAIGLVLAAAILAGWLLVHVASMFLFRFERDPPLLFPVLVAVQCWLNVGLFIVAHDAMHGSLAPYRPALNRAIGRLCLALYAGFSYDRLIGEHMAHHRHAGTELDPDFHADDARRFWPWYLAFIRRYFGLREFLTIGALIALYVGLLGIPVANALLLWALPAILSSMQLFYFGTYRPHRHDEEPFSDEHRARSDAFGWPVSLLTCFHFGYHHEHHTHPGVPWWRLPAWRRAG